MAGQLRVLSRANGQPPCPIMLVGEAPGRLGAGRTGQPFTGDASGRRLEHLIAAAGWRREQLFITNAVLCCPRDAHGRNRPPTRTELSNCAAWLQAQLEVVDPVLVVALGAVALRALAGIAPHPLRVQDAAAPAPIAWNGRWLATAYHPSARAAIHRPVELQRSDFQRLGAWFTQFSAETGASR